MVYNTSDAIGTRATAGNSNSQYDEPSRITANNSGDRAETMNDICNAQLTLNRWTKSPIKILIVVPTTGSGKKRTDAAVALRP